ncbi:protein kinase [Streptomyces sp. NPDC088387]|uniref:serine/threonine-protein kinase n=1 Tax=Streptomyces sp. NPDC088387 TaxID=3365859 RepID=UPI0038102B73
MRTGDGTGMALRDSDPAEVGGYRIEDRLGSGGMGVVYLARSASGRRLAVKVVHDQYAGDDEFRARFRRELAAARRVSGAFTAPVVDADADASRPWMATLYIPGETLGSHVRRHGPLALPELRELAAGLAEALRDIHRAGVVHRDLKPANVMLADDGPRVIDFGISRAAESAADALTQTGRVLGTPPFMSPEQFSAPLEVGPASDVFSLGAVVTFAATGRGPFDSPSPYETAVRVVQGTPDLLGVPQELLHFIRECLQQDVKSRPTAADLVALLDSDELLRAITTPPRAPTPDRPATDPRSTRSSDTEWAGAGWPARETPEAEAPPAVVLSGPLSPTPDEPPPTPRRGRRRRVLLSAAAVTAVLAAIATTTFVLNRDDGDSTDRTTTTTAARSDLPSGWRPWSATVKAPSGSDGPGNGFESCVRAASSVVCAGDGLMAAGFALADGNREWSLPTDPTPIKDYDSADGAIIGVHGSQVYAVGSDARGTADINTHHFTVQALAADSGKVIWRTETGAGGYATPPNASQGGAAAVAEGVIVFRGDQSESYALLDAEDGKVRWTRPVPQGGGGCEIRGRAGHAYLSCTTGRQADGSARTSVSQLDPATGKPRWTTDEVDGFLEVVGESNGQLVVTDRVDGTHVLRRIDTRTGAVRTLNLSQPQSASTNVHLVRGTLYFTLRSGMVRAFSPTTGQLRWERNSTIEQQGPPAASATHVYVASPGGRVAALNARTGAVEAALPGRDDSTDEYGLLSASGRPLLLVGDALYIPYGIRSVFTVDVTKL